MKKISFFTLVFLSLFFQKCAPDSALHDNTADSGYIVCTTNIVADLIDQIKPPSVAIMKPGTDPHLYKSKSGDHQLFNSAQVIVYSGLHLEGKITDALEHLAHSKKVINLSDGIPIKKLISNADFGGSFDPHFWFDIDLYQLTVEHASTALTEAFPDKKDSIRTRANAYLNAIKATEIELKDEINKLPVESRILVTAHDAFSYFGRKYNFIVKGVQGASTASEAGLKDITLLVDYIIKNKVPAIFVESSVSERNIKAIIEGCAGAGHPVKLGGTLYSDALGAKKGEAGTYLKMMKYNIRTITNALQNSDL